MPHPLTSGWLLPHGAHGPKKEEQAHQQQKDDDPSDSHHVTSPTLWMGK
jgi:hypothetical protein